MAADGVRFRKEVEHAEAVRKSVDMEDDMLQDVIEVARRALLQNELEKDVAREIKTYLDSKYVYIHVCESEISRWLYAWSVVVG